ncbi:MAG: DAK2 domain-containing protein [Kineosporiaceae bacterium]
MVLQALDATAARRWAGTLLAALAGAREEIDALNVYPVPDGDTGTNLYMTVEAGYAAAADLAPEAGLVEVTEAFAGGVLLGARGNSGAIFAQMIRAWSQAVGESGVLDGPTARRALVLADEQAWGAVDRPVHGTMLSLSRAAAEAALALPADAPLVEVVVGATEAARHALSRTPRQLDVLRRAGVVDAGGKGVLLALRALVDVVRGEQTLEGTAPGRRRPARAATLPPVDLSWCDDADPTGPAYEVMYLLHAADDAVAALRARLAELGESLVVVGGAGLWHVHVHVDRPGEAVEAAVEVGRPSQIRITSLVGHPHEAPPAHARGAARLDAALAAGVEPPSPEAMPELGLGLLPPPGVPAAGARRATSALLACATGPGLATLFVGAGAQVVEVGPGRGVTAARLLDAVRAARAEAVALLPNDPDVLAAAQAAAAMAREEGVRVSVVPTRAQVQGLAAAAVHDPARRFDDDVVLMSSAAGATREGALTRAPGPVGQDGWFGVVGGDVLTSAAVDEGGAGAARVAVAVLDRLLAAGGELVTLVSGAEVPEDLVAAVCAHLGQRHPDVEVSLHDGGQPRWPLLIGVE